MRSIIGQFTVKNLILMTKSISCAITLNDNQSGGSKDQQCHSEGYGESFVPSTEENDHFLKCAHPEQFNTSWKLFSSRYFVFKYTIHFLCLGLYEGEIISRRN